MKIPAKEEIMRNWQRVIALTLIGGLVPLPYGGWGTILRAATPPNAVLAKQRADLFGVGAEVEVKLASGKKLKGVIEAIESDSFALTSPRENSPRQIAYDEAAELKMARSTFRASGGPNPEEARRVAVGLGVGKHVAVKVTSGKTIRGNIKAINEDHFVVLPDRETSPVEVAYGDVQKLGPNLSKGATIMIIVGIVVAAVVIVVVATADDVADVFR